MGEAGERKTMRFLCQDMESMGVDMKSLMRCYVVSQLVSVRYRAVESTCANAESRSKHRCKRFRKAQNS